MIVILDLAGVLAKTLDTMRSREAAAARHQLLELFLLAGALSALNMAVHRILLEVLESRIMVRLPARQLVGFGQIRVEAALVGVLFVFVVGSRLVLLLDGALSLQIQVNVSIARRRMSALGEHALVGLGVQSEFSMFLRIEFITNLL